MMMTQVTTQWSMWRSILSDVICLVHTTSCWQASCWRRLVPRALLDCSDLNWTASVTVTDEDAKHLSLLVVSAVDVCVWWRLIAADVTDSLLLCPTSTIILSILSIHLFPIYYACYICKHIRHQCNLLQQLNRIFNNLSESNKHMQTYISVLKAHKRLSIFSL